MARACSNASNGVQLLLRHHADVKAHDSDGKSVLALTCEHKDLEEEEKTDVVCAILQDPDVELEPAFDTWMGAKGRVAKVLVKRLFLQRTQQKT